MSLCVDEGQQNDLPTLHFADDALLIHGPSAYERIDVRNYFSDIEHSLCFRDHRLVDYIIDLLVTIQACAVNLRPLLLSTCRHASSHAILRATFCRLVLMMAIVLHVDSH